MDLKELKERNYDISGVDPTQLNSLKDTLPLVCSADYENALYEAGVEYDSDLFSWFMLDIDPDVSCDEYDARDEVREIARNIESDIEYAFTQKGDVLGVVEDGRYTPLPLYIEFKTGDICPLSDVFNELTKDLEDSYDSEYETESYHFDMAYGNYLPDTTTHSATVSVDWNFDLEEEFEKFRKGVSELPVGNIPQEQREQLMSDLTSDYRQVLEPAKPVSKSKTDIGEEK